jgi:hypothetical protein
MRVEKDDLVMMAREALRAASNLWPNAALAEFVIATEDGTTGRIRSPDRYHAATPPAQLLVSAVDLAACAGRRELMALAARLGRGYVYDLGLADGA